MGDILIVTGGPVKESFCRRYIASGEWDLVIAADRGLELLRECAVDPDLILGDFDSADQQVVSDYEKRFPERIRRYPSKKDETDTELALEQAFACPQKRIHILGALGGRTDHMLANIQLLLRAVKKGRICYLVGESCRIYMTDRPIVIYKSEQTGTLISLLAYGKDVKDLTLKGFAYETDHLTLAADSSRGISNYLTDEKGAISFSEGIILIIETTES